MKKIVNFSKIILGSLLVLTAMNSCKNETKPQASQEIVENQNNVKLENSAVENDANLLEDVAEINLSEIEIGKLAQTKGLSQDVRNYGKMLVEDHIKAMEELKTLANKKTITLPILNTEVATVKYNILKAKTGAEFDKKFSEMMTEGHQKAVDIMTEIAQKAKDNDIRLWASRQVSVLTKHTEEAKKLK